MKRFGGCWEVKGKFVNTKNVLKFIIVKKEVICSQDECEVFIHDVYNSN